jgi:Lecithin:cholesterol acyltransferase
MVSVSPGESADVRTHFDYVAEWEYGGVARSTDANATPFGPKQWPLRQGIIRRKFRYYEATLTDDDRKEVLYLPVPRINGTPTYPSLSVVIALRKRDGGDSVRGSDWANTDVDVLVSNLFRLTDGKARTIALKGKLDETLTCRIDIPAADVETWFKLGAPLGVEINDNLIDFQFTLNGVKEMDGNPVQGQARTRVFLYCRQNIVFLPGLFGSQLKYTTSDKEIHGYPDWWNDPIKDAFPPNPLALIPDLSQKADFLECDDQGVPLVACPKPTLLMLRPFGWFGLDKDVIHPFQSVHDARMALYPKVPEGFLLFTLIIHPYDWRADLTDAAAELLKRLFELQIKLQQEGDNDDQITVVGHSTGGVIIRRALAPIEKSELGPGVDAAVKSATLFPSDRLIKFACFLSVPFSGAPKAGAVLMTGQQEPGGEPMIPFIDPNSLRHVSLSMPIVYHLHVSAQYPHRPLTSPSRPPGVPHDNEADKAMFMSDLIAAGLFPAPYQVKASVTDKEHRLALARGAAKWHELAATEFARRNGLLGLYLPDDISNWEDGLKKAAARARLSYQYDARTKGGWNAFLAARAKAFHEKSHVAVTGVWKQRACIIWGTCAEKPTLRQLNLFKGKNETFSSKEAYLGQISAMTGGMPPASFETPPYGTLVPREGDYVGGKVMFVIYRPDGPRLNRTEWHIEWISQYNAGDTTVPSDSQLAERKNVKSIWLTKTSGEMYPHMESTKSEAFWSELLVSLDNNRLLGSLASEDDVLAKHGELSAVAGSANLRFNP